MPECPRPGFVMGWGCLPSAFGLTQWASCPRASAPPLPWGAPAEEPAGRLVEVLEFELSGERYAVATSFVTEVFPLVSFTELFCTPPFVLGITNLRGRIVSIVDLRRFFDNDVRMIGQFL